MSKHLSPVTKNTSTILTKNYFGIQNDLKSIISRKQDFKALFLKDNLYTIRDKRSSYLNNKDHYKCRSQRTHDISIPNTSLKKNLNSNSKTSPSDDNNHTITKFKINSELNDQTKLREIQTKKVNQEDDHNIATILLRKLERMENLDKNAKTIHSKKGDSQKKSHLFQTFNFSKRNSKIINN